MTILLRLCAFLVQTCLLAAISLAVLLWDAKAHILYGWNSAHLGHVVLAVCAIALYSVGTQPILYKLFGLRLLLSNGTVTSFPHRFTRELLFWLLILAPSTFRIPDLFSALPLSTRERILGAVGAGFALMLLPPVTILLSRGRSSIHDLLARTIVIRKRHDALCAQTPPSLLPMRVAVASYLLLVSILLLAATLFDWRFQISDTVSAFLRARAPYLSTVVQAAQTNASSAADVIDQTSPTRLYINADRTAFFEGLTESFRLRVSPYVLSSPYERRLAVLNFMVTVSRNILPTTKWVAIRVYSDQWFGAAGLEQAYDFLIDITEGKVNYAPTHQAFTYGKEHLDLEGFIEKKGLVDSVLTTFSPKLFRAFRINNITWDFPRLDFVAKVTGPSKRLIGP